MRAIVFLGTLGLGLGAGACGADGDSGGGPEGGFEINVSPLTLPAATDVCHSLEVRNEAEATVWDEDWICASQFGFGTALTYIGTCDADDGDVESPAEANNTVALTMRAICADGDCVDTSPADLVADNDVGEWQNPCPAGSPCELTALCVENQDTTVVFNITVLREANQGFFDIVVNFEDIFCSAKLDCFEELLPNPYSDPPGARDSTVVVGFACTGGTNSATQLHFNQGSIVCTGGSNQALSIDFATDGLEIGNMDHAYTVTVTDLDGIDPPQVLDDSAAPLVFQHTYYRGIEELDALHKVYSNTAYGLDYDGIGAALDNNVTACTYVNTMTASDGPLPAGWVYPKVQFCADVGPGCGPFPLNGGLVATADPYNPGGAAVSGGVFTSYVNPNGDENGTLCGSETLEDYTVCIGDTDGNLTDCSAR